MIEKYTKKVKIKCIIYIYVCVDFNIVIAFIISICLDKISKISHYLNFNILCNNSFASFFLELFNKYTIPSRFIILVNG